MSSIFVQSFIDVDKWNEAEWKATAFMYDPDPQGAPPCMGIAFQNITAGREIFDGWRKRLGQLDAYDELRIAIVEGDIPGQMAGYSVHISSEPYNTQKRARDNGQNLDVDKAMVIGRIHRMNPDPGSPHLPNFKREYAKHGKYLLVPVEIIGNQYKPDFDYAIGKQQVFFRQVSELTKNDIDAVVLKRPE